MTKNIGSTRYFSSKQEKRVAKSLGGKRTANSGALDFFKGDINIKDWLLECKTCMKDKDSFSIKKEWLLKLKEESFAMNKSYNALVFNYGPDQENYYIINEKLFKQLIDFLANF